MIVLMGNTLEMEIKKFDISWYWDLSNWNIRSVDATRRLFKSSLCRFSGLSPQSSGISVWCNSNQIEHKIRSRKTPEFSARDIMLKMYWFALRDCRFYQCLSPLHCYPVCQFHILDRSFSSTLTTSFRISLLMYSLFDNMTTNWKLDHYKVLNYLCGHLAIPVQWTGYRAHLVVSSVSALLGPGPRLLSSPQLSVGFEGFSCFTPDNCESGLDRNEGFCSMTARNLSSFQQ